ncbi:MAG: transposase, partial [Mediterraneibacter faecis]
MLFKRTEETAFRGRGKNERTALIINSLRGAFKLKDLLSYTGMPKATFMYWQKRLDRENPDKELEEKIVEIRKAQRDYGYRRTESRITRKSGVYLVNKKKVQKLMQKLNLQ